MTLDELLLDVNGEKTQHIATHYTISDRLVYETYIHEIHNLTVSLL